MDDLELKQRVAQLLAPMRGDKQALELAITGHLHENVLRIANGGDAELDVIEAELRHQAEALIDPEGTLQRKVKALMGFLEHDIQHRLHVAAQEGLEARGKAQSVAQEATLDIHQLLTLAKKDLSPDVAPLLKARIESLEARYSGDAILEKLRTFLGLDFVDETREELKRADADEKPQVLEAALTSVAERFENERVRAQVVADLEALRAAFGQQ